MKPRGFIVAIDGPAGSGKSTTARLCARRLGFCYLDTGAMYRAVTLKVLEGKVATGDRAALCRLLKDTRIQLHWQAGRLRVKLDGRDVTRRVRSPEVDELVSAVSAVPEVRMYLVNEQRRLAEGKKVVCEGRDIGSVVFPEADLKIFLDCDIDERAGRRARELRLMGKKMSAAAVKKNLSGRDRIDSSRPMSPLRRMPDAVLIDTTDLTIEEQVAIVCALIKRRWAASG